MAKGKDEKPTNPEGKLTTIINPTIGMDHGINIRVTADFLKDLYHLDLTIRWPTKRGRIARYYQRVDISGDLKDSFLQDVILVKTIYLLDQAKSHVQYIAAHKNMRKSLKAKINVKLPVGKKEK